MEATQCRTQGHLEAAPRDDDQELSPGDERLFGLEDGQENVVIVNLAEFAAMGAQSHCLACLSDLVVPPTLDRDEYRNSAWASPTAA